MYAAGAGRRHAPPGVQSGLADVLCAHGQLVRHRMPHLKHLDTAQHTTVRPETSFPPDPESSACSCGVHPAQAPWQAASPLRDQHSIFCEVNSLTSLLTDHTAQHADEAVLTHQHADYDNSMFQTVSAA